MRLLLLCLLVSIPLSTLRAQDDPTPLDAARAALARRDYDAALARLAEAGDGPERDRLEGEVRFFRGELEASAVAIERYLAAAGDAPHVARARFRLAEVLSRLGQFERAVTLARDGLGSVADPERRLGFARRLIERGRKHAEDPEKPDYHKALRFYDEAAIFVEADPDLRGTLAFRTAWVKAKLGRHGEVVPALATLLGVSLPAPIDRVAPDRTRLPTVDVDRPPLEPRLADAAQALEARRMLADALAAIGQPGLARETYRAVIDEKPNGVEAPAALIGIARTYGFPTPPYRHALERGGAALEALLARFGDHERASEALELLAFGYRAFQRPERARDYFARLVKRFPTSARALPAARAIAHLHLEAGEFDRALAAYDAALATFPAHAEWSAIRRERVDCEYAAAKGHLARGDRDGAADAFAAFIARHPLDARVPATLLELASIARALEDRTRAVEWYTTLASKYPKSPEATTALLERAGLEERAGDLDAALATLRSIPNNGGAGRIAELRAESVGLETRHVDGKPRLVLTTRNVRSVELRAYRISAADYFEKHRTMAGVASLDVPLIRPDRTWTIEPADFRAMKHIETTVPLGDAGAGAWVVSAASGERRATSLIILGELRVVARMAGDRIDAFVGRGERLEPVEGAVIKVAGTDRIVLDAKTDANGLLSGVIPRHRRPSGTTSLIAMFGDEVAWARLEVPESFRPAPAAERVLMWLDRSRYRVGETVRYFTLAKPGDRRDATVTLRSSTGVVLQSLPLAADAGGVASGTLPLVEALRPGRYAVRVLRGKTVLAEQPIDVAGPVDASRRVAVRADRSRITLGEVAAFDVRVTTPAGRPVGHAVYRYRLSGDAAVQHFVTDGAGRARVAVRSDRFGLTDSVAMDVFDGDRWVAGDIVRVGWDGYRATVTPERGVFLVGETIRATVRATSFDGEREARDVTVVVERVRDGQPALEVCRVPVRTSDRGDDVAVVLPVDGEGAFSVSLEGDRTMVATGSAIFVSGADDPKRIRILAGREATRPDTTHVLRVHSRLDGASALLVVANHRDRRVRRLTLTKGLNEVTIPIRAQDLPWVRVRIGVPSGDAFHTDEVTIAVDDPLAVSVDADASVGRPGAPLTFSVRTTEPGGGAVPATAIVLLVPAELAPLYRGVFQGVEEAFLGETKAPDSPLASSYPFAYGGAAEQVKIVAEQVDYASNWSSIVDRRAVLNAMSANPIGQDADAFRYSARRQAETQSRDYAQNIFANKQQPAPQRGTPALSNGAFLNQGSSAVMLAAGETVQILSGTGDRGIAGTFQAVDAPNNRWATACVVLGSKGTVALPTEDIEMRLRRLAQRRLARGDRDRAPRILVGVAGDDGVATIRTTRPEGRWRALVLVSGHARGRAAEATCDVEGAWPVEARVVAPTRAVVGDTSSVDVLLRADEPSRATVRIELDGAEPDTRDVAVGPDGARVRFAWNAGGRAGRVTGRVVVGEQVLPVAIDIAASTPIPDPFVVRVPADGATHGAAGAIRATLADVGGPLGDAAWILARLAEHRAAGSAASDDAELRRRIVRLTLAERPQGGYGVVRTAQSIDLDATVLVAWAIGDAARAGVVVDPALAGRLSTLLRQEFGRRHRTDEKTIALVGLSRVTDVDFAFANRLYRTRDSLGARDQALLLLLLRRGGDNTPMVRTLAAALAGRIGEDGAFADDETPTAAFHGARAATALAALALRGLQPDAARRALDHLAARPVAAALAPAALAVEAVALDDATPGGQGWRIDATDPAKTVALQARRTIRYAAMTRYGYPTRRRFDVDGYRFTDDKTDVVGEAKRFTVSLEVRMPYAMATAILEERLPAGVRVVSTDVGTVVRDGVLRSMLASHDVTRKGYRWYTLRYVLEAEQPGAVRFATPRVRVIGGAPHVVGARTERARFTIVAAGEDDRANYALSPGETYDLGVIHYAQGEFDAARGYLSTYLTKWRPRRNARVAAAAMLLDIDVRRGDAKAMVDHFEVLKEGDPERAVPFRKIVPVADAYRTMGEFERAYQVARGALDGFFQVDFGLAHALLSAGDVEAFRDVTASLLLAYPEGATTGESRMFVGQALFDHARKQKDPAARATWLDAARATFEAGLAEAGGLSRTEPIAFSLSGVLLEAERHAAAAAVCRRAVELYPDTALTDGFQYVLAYSLFERGEHDEAGTICERIATGRYRTADGGRGPSGHRDLALHMQAKIFHARGDIPKAVAAYRKVRERIPEAARALDYFEWRTLSLPELTELAGNEDRRLRLSYKNVDRVAVKVYRVDLMALYLRERSLNRIARINLAGVSPFFAGDFAVRPSTYRMDEIALLVCREAQPRDAVTDPIPVVLPDAGAYLVVVRSGATESMGMVLRTDLRLDVQAIGDTLRATVYDRTSGSFLNRVPVKFVGDRSKAFIAAKTDLRGVAEAGGIVGAPTVIAKRGDQFAFFRSAAALGHGPSQRGPRFKTPRKEAQRLGLFQEQMKRLQSENYDRVQQQQRARGGVRIKQVK